MVCFRHLNITQSYSETKVHLVLKQKNEKFTLIPRFIIERFKKEKKKGMVDEGLSYNLFHKCHIFSLRGKDLKIELK